MAAFNVIPMNYDTLQYVSAFTDEGMASQRAYMCRTFFLFS